MKSLKKLKKVLGEIEITKEQQSALNDFFEELSASIEAKAADMYENQIEEKEREIEELSRAVEINESSSEGMITIEEAEAAFNAFKSDAERAFIAFESDAENAFIAFESDAENAFNLFAEDSEKAFSAFENDAEKAFTAFESDAESAFRRFENDAEKAFNMFMEEAETAGEMMNEDLKNIYAEKSMKAIEDLYESVEKEVKGKFAESGEYRALMDIKRTVTPLVLEESEDDLARKIVSLSTEKETLVEELESLKKKEIITSLISDFPEKEADIIREFIEKGKSENEIYERFSSIIEILEAKTERNDFSYDTVEDFEDEIEDRQWVPDRSTVTTESRKSSTKKFSSVKNRQRSNIITEGKRKKTASVKPYFESHATDRPTKKSVEGFQPHEAKIISQVFGN